jgi:hypothetical protein
MMTQEALKLALEALEVATTPLAKDRQEVLRAITAIKEALAQTEHEFVRGECVKCSSSIERQKPVVWMYQDKSTHEVRFQKHMRDFVDHGATYETPLYTTPPRRTWVGLTEERVKEIWLKGKDHGDDWTDVLALARSFEAELKGLNT